MIRPTLSTHSQRAQVPPGRGRLPWTVLLPWAITGAILVGTALYAFVPTTINSNPAAPGESGALVWGDGLFTNPLELQAWLRIRGVTYKEWAQKHPAGVKLLAPQPVPLAKKSKVVAKKPAPKPAAKPPAPAAKPTRVARAPTQASAKAEETATPNWMLPALLACAGAAALILLRFRLPALWR